MNAESTRPEERLWRLGVAALVGVIATLGYQTTQRAGFASAVVRADCWSWHWLSFRVAWFWPYVSMFLLMGLPWFLLRTRRAVVRFAATVVATAAAGWIVFVLFPTACARPDPTGLPSYYQALMALDRPNNCLPCLHSAFAVLGAVALAVGSEAFRPTWARLALAGWVVLILVSIVALRQHTDVDTAAGALLGALAAWGWAQPKAAALRAGSPSPSE